MVGVRGIVFAVFCMTQLYAISAITNVEHQKIEFPDKELIFSDDSQKDGKLTYASCTKNTESKERQCTVVREKSPYSDDTYSCDVTIKPERPDNSDMDTDKLSVRPYAENKAILTGYVINGHIQYATVNFDTCNVTNYEMALIDLTSDGNREALVVYKDSFDYFALLQPLEKYYILKFDADGTKQDLPIGPTDPERYSSKVTDIVPISESRDKGTLYAERAEGNEFEFKIRKPDGSNVSMGKRVVYEPKVVATNDDLIGICFKMQDSGPKFNCTQNDLNGEEKFNINPLKDDEKAAVVSVRNLPGGGMLIAVGSCEEEICSFYQVQFAIIKVDTTGAIVGTANVGQVKPVSNSNDVQMSLSFHKNKDQNDCISIVNFESTETSRRDRGDIAATDYCFTDDDFKK